MANINLTKEQVADLKKRKLFLLNQIENVKVVLVESTNATATEDIRSLQKNYWKYCGRLAEINYLLDED